MCHSVSTLCHSVSNCVKLSLTLLKLYLVVQGKPNGDILTLFPNFIGPDYNLQLKNISNDAALIKEFGIYSFNKSMDEY